MLHRSHDYGNAPDDDSAVTKHVALLKLHAADLWHAWGYAAAPTQANRGREIHGKELSHNVSHQNRRRKSQPT